MTDHVLILTIMLAVMAGLSACCLIDLLRR